MTTGKEKVAVAHIVDFILYLTLALARRRHLNSDEHHNERAI